jgi:LysM repeat protein
MNNLSGKKIISTLICFLSFYTSASWAQSKIDTVKYSFLHKEFNMLQFYNRDAINGFYNGWKQTETKRFCIVHTGDSHIQIDILPGVVRKNLQSMFGDGGRGLIYPYSTAKSYSPIDYKTTHTGKWTFAKSFILPPKLPLGICGMTSRTSDVSASMTFSFFDQLPLTYTRLKIFCDIQINSYDMVIEAGGDRIQANVFTPENTDKSYVEVNLPPIGKQFKIKLNKTSAAQNGFEIYGFSLETKDNKGVIYHNAGTGAAQFKAIINEKYFSKQLKVLNPDVVILDFGTNDFMYNDSIQVPLESEITGAINAVKSVAPEATIVLTTAHDMTRYGKFLRSGQKFSDLIHQIARNNHTAFWDWYWITGGFSAMKNLYNTGLAQQDGVHLTNPGYILKGELLSQAMMNTYVKLEKDNKSDSLIFNLENLKISQAKLFAQDSLFYPGVKFGKESRYQIMPGDNLIGIANKFGVTVNDIKAWNNLSSSRIIAGKYLIIFPVKKKTNITETKKS